MKHFSEKQVKSFIKFYYNEKTLKKRNFTSMFKKAFDMFNFCNDYRSGLDEYVDDLDTIYWELNAIK